jgi:nucleotide-binding universal stress UspA family protein
LKTVMVGFDGSDQARDALELGATFADRLGGDLVVAVVDELDLFAGEILGAKERAAYLEETLDLAARQLGEQQFEGKTTWGSVPECLDLIASDVSADILVVGSTHRGEIGRVVPGSVGERLLAGAPCAVAVAPNGYAHQEEAPLERIGVGLDGEEESEAALHLANEVAVAIGGTVRLIAVAPILEELIPGRISGTAPGYARFARDHLAGELKRATATSSPTIEIAEVLAEGDPAEVLCEQSRDLDLLVLGSRGYGPLRRVFLGGVASKVIRHASCPVLITPRSAQHARRHRAQETLASTVL